MSALFHLLRRSCVVVVAFFVAFCSFGTASAEETAPAKKSLKILILGGTGFLGPATVDAALARGHEVTMFNRGRTRPELYPEVNKLNGDRDPDKGEGLKALESGQWDVVIDNSGYYPRMVKASAELLSTRSKQYIYISSVSAYKEPNPIYGEVDAPLATMEDPTLEEMGQRFENFGPLKALCEQAAEAAMPGRTTIVRPGYIVGPDDPTGRFTYWPVKFDKGGKQIVPGNPNDPVQIIDVRDLGEWLVKLAEDGTMGLFTATGPADALKWGELIEACIEASTADIKPVAIWACTDIIEKTTGIGTYPIWIPSVGYYAGFHLWSNKKAVEAGLKSRPVIETVQDTLTWYKEQQKIEKGRTRLAAPTDEMEAKVLETLRSEAERTLELLKN